MRIVIFMSVFIPAVVAAATPSTEPGPQLPPPDAVFDKQLTDLLEPVYTLPLRDRLTAMSAFVGKTHLDRDERYPIQKLLRFGYDHRQDTAIPTAPMVMAHFFAKSFGFEPQQFAEVLVPYYGSTDHEIVAIADQMLVGSLFFRIQGGLNGLTMPEVDRFLFGRGRDLQSLPSQFWHSLFAMDPVMVFEMLDAHNGPRVSEETQKMIAVLQHAANPIGADAQEREVIKKLSREPTWYSRAFCLSMMERNRSLRDLELVRSLRHDTAPTISAFADALYAQFNEEDQEQLFETPNPDARMRKANWGFYSQDQQLSSIDWDRPFGGGSQGFGSLDALPVRTPHIVALASPFRIPKWISLNWYGADGKFATDGVRLDQLIKDPNHFYGTIWLVQEAGRWRAVPLTDEQETELKKRTGSEVPEFGSATNQSTRSHDR